MVAKIEQIFLVGKNPWKNWSCHTIFADFRRAVWRVRSWILVKFLTGKVLVPAAAAGAGAGAAGASKIFAQNFKSLFGVEGLYWWLLSCEEVAGLLLLLFTVIVEVPIGFHVT